MKSKLFLLIILMSFIVFSCGQESTQDNPTVEKKEVPVRILTVEPQEFIEFGEYYGKITGIKEAQLICVLGGRVEEITVRVGDYVTAGMSLAKINSESAMNTFELAVLGEKVAREDYERQKKFLESGNSSEVMVDNAHLNWLNSKSLLLDAEKAYEGALCITPISGIVVSKFIDLYQELPPGTPTFIVADLSKLKVTIGIPENDIKGVEPGDRVEVSFSMYPDKVWEGTISSVGKKVSPYSLTFPVEIIMDNPDGLLLSGVTAHVKVFSTYFENQVVVPIHTVLTMGTENYVMVVNDNTAHKYPVEIGYTSDTQMLITGGLKFGDKLIIEGNHIVEDGTPVKVIE
jgi:RND family efflux transporter MFP subunit